MEKSYSVGDTIKLKPKEWFERNAWFYPDAKRSWGDKYSFANPEDRAAGIGTIVKQNCWAGKDIRLVCFNTAGEKVYEYIWTDWIDDSYETGIDPNIKLNPKEGGGDRKVYEHISTDWIDDSYENWIDDSYETGIDDSKEELPFWETRMMELIENKDAGTLYNELQNPTSDLSQGLKDAAKKSPQNKLIEYVYLELQNSTFWAHFDSSASKMKFCELVVSSLDKRNFINWKEVETQFLEK